MQESIATTLAAKPDLKINYIDDPSRPPGDYDARALPDRPTIDEAQDLALDRALAAIDALLARSPWASMYLQATAARPPGDAAARARARQAIGAGIGLRHQPCLQGAAEQIGVARIDARLQRTALAEDGKHVQAAVAAEQLVLAVEDALVDRRPGGEPAELAVNRG